MTLMKSLVATVFLMVSFCVVISDIYAFGLNRRPICFTMVNPNDANQHKAGQPLKATVGDPGHHFGKSVSLTLPADKNFHQLKKGDLLYSHGVVHQYIGKEKLPNGNYRASFKPTKLIIDQKQQLH
jgi:hypothetical protein